MFFDIDSTETYTSNAAIEEIFSVGNDSGKNYPEFF